MKCKGAAAVLAGLALTLAAAGCGEEVDGIRQFHTFLQETEQEKPAERSERVNEFLTDIATQGIHVPLTGDTSAVFLYQGPGKRVLIAGDHTGWEPSDTLNRLEGTNFHYLERTFPRDARLDYKFMVDGDYRLDPLNTITIRGGYGENSVLRMPGYDAPQEILPHEGVPMGDLDTLTVNSRALGGRREATVYKPATYGDDLTRTFPTLYVHDGADYLELARMRTVLDNAIASGICVPLVVVFVPPEDRLEEYWFHEPARTFIVDELIPEVEHHFRVKQTARSRGTMGASMGGVFSIWLGHTRPDVFRRVGGQSSAIWIGEDHGREVKGWMLDRIRQDAPTPVTYYLDVGTFEGDRYLELHRELVALLREKGNDVTYEEHHDGHSWGNWRAHIDDLLAALYPPDSQDEDK